MCIEKLPEDDIYSSSLLLRFCLLSCPQILFKARNLFVLFMHQYTYNTDYSQPGNSICAFCNTPIEEGQYGKMIAGYPSCISCTESVARKTFPTWVKVFLSAILLITIGAFFWNWRFYTAFQTLKTAHADLEKEQYADAAMHMAEAARKVPEVKDLQALANYYAGLSFLRQDKGKEALAAFEKCQYQIPEDMGIKELMLNAKIDAAFDSKDYTGFVEASKEFLALDTTNANAYCTLASAYACIYADKSIPEAKANALHYLQLSKEKDTTHDAELAAYQAFVRHRIDSKSIITFDAYTTLYPDQKTPQKP